ncbi:MAG: hypothetical protein Ta2E_10380 [Mycoplasmoidaceae bacterium]|nr:MAG: hypothetical protein Ta2E_10380 [Mycoplasmoidaceae bacterium]
MNCYNNIITERKIKSHFFETDISPSNSGSNMNLTSDAFDNLSNNKRIDLRKLNLEIDREVCQLFSLSMYSFHDSSGYCPTNFCWTLITETVSELKEWLYEKF